MLNIKTILLLVGILFSFCSFAQQSKADKKMGKENILTVIIEKPINEVFEFTTDPAKTSEWINSIEIEKTNTWPPRVGTVYQNRGKTGPWSFYTVTKYDLDKEFELKKSDDNYHVKYSYSECGNGETKLVYHEWVTTGELSDPFTQETLNNLKMIIETRPRLRL